MNIFISKKFTELLKNDSGATLVEYGIAIVLAVTVGTFGLISLAVAINGNLADAVTALQ